MFRGFLSAIINAGSGIVICSVLLVEELQCTLQKINGYFNNGFVTGVASSYIIFNTACDHNGTMFG